MKKVISSQTAILVLINSAKQFFHVSIVKRYIFSRFPVYEVSQYNFLLVEFFFKKENSNYSHK